jgi:hypothetical protein
LEREFSLFKIIKRGKKMTNRITNNASKTIATTNTIVSPATYGSGYKRIALVLKNTSSAGEVISISLGEQAVSGRGIVLNQGDTYATSKDGGYIPPQSAVNALATAATATLSIYEEVEYE